MVKKKKYKRVAYDLGCGPGAIDAISYARKHPDTLVIAVDMRDVIVPKDELPNNLKVVDKTSYYNYRPPYKADLIMFNFPEQGPKQLPDWALPALKKGGVLEIRTERLLSRGQKEREVDYETRDLREFVEGVKKKGFEVRIRKYKSPPMTFIGKAISEVLGKKRAVQVGKTGAAGLAPRGYTKMVIKRPENHVFKKVRKKKRVGWPIRKR